MKDCSDAKMRKTGRSEADAVEIEPSITALWYNNLRPAAYAAVHILCADALSRIELKTLNHAKPQRVRVRCGRFAAFMI